MLGADDHRQARRRRCTRRAAAPAAASPRSSAAARRSVASVMPLSAPTLRRGATTRPRRTAAAAVRCRRRSSVASRSARAMQLVVEHPLLRSRSRIARAHARPAAGPRTRCSGSSPPARAPSAPILGSSSTTFCVTWPPRATTTTRTRAAAERHELDALERRRRRTPASARSRRACDACDSTCDTCDSRSRHRRRQRDLLAAAALRPGGRRAPGAGRSSSMIDVDAIAQVGRHAAGRGVRLLDVAQLLEPRQDVADGGRRHAEARPAHQRRRGDRLAVSMYSRTSDARIAVLVRSGVRIGIMIV